MDENYFGITDTGKIRVNNEDTFIAEPIENGQLILAAVIDGVGGYKGGEVAADLARKAIKQQFTKAIANTDKIAFLKQALFLANEAIFNERVKSDENNQMACVLTLIIADIINNKIYYAHVGDTRLYLFRDNTLVKISHDQSFVGFLEDSGRLTEAEAMNHAKRNEINKALGFDGNISAEDYVETGESPFLPGDILLLCSDGLSDMIDRKAMISVLGTTKNLKAKAKLLVEAANIAGGKDNITAVLVLNDKSLVRYTATKPASASQAQPLSQPQPLLTTEYKAPEIPKPVAKKTGSGAIPILTFLVVLLLLACAWLFYQYYHNKNQTAAIEQVTVDSFVRKSDKEKTFIDSVNGLFTREIFMLNTPGEQALQISDSIVIKKDTLHIIGNGATLTPNYRYKGPAFIISPQAKYILLDSLVLENFDVGIIVTNNALHFNKVTFKNCRVPVQYNFKAADSGAVSGHFINGVFNAKDSLPASLIP